MPHISAQEVAVKDTLDLLAKLVRLEDEGKPSAFHKVAEQKAYDGADLPVVGIEVYRKDVVVIRKGESVKSGPHSTRGEIFEMSDDSLRRLAFLANNFDKDFRSMVTLTYPNEFPTDGAIVKAHLGSMLRSLKRRLGEPLTYVWFLEFQKRGAPHVHILLTVGLTNEEAPILRSWLSQRWYKIVRSGDENHLLAGTNWQNTRQAEGLRHYVVKYAFKTYQKEVPEGFRHVGRFWGASRDVQVEPILIEMTDEERIRGCLVSWPYNGSLEAKIPRVLYNAASYWMGAVTT
jgi:hypothetical protein